MKLSRLILTASLIGLAQSAFAGSAQPKRVLELFTSQGCSSCPPANEFAGEMAEEPETLVLSYGVTYWDYLGWQDTFADPDFTQRQRDYGKALGSANVYTPQMILNGSAHGPHYSKSDVKSMDLPQNQPDIKLTKDQGRLLATFGTQSQTPDYQAVLVEYVAGPQSVPVKAGENRGLVLSLSNVVTHIKPLGAWDKKAPLATQIKPKPGKAYALLLHDPKTMALSAAVTYTD
ncbi:MAG: DUF1223 domain-containing protein [Alphaproteobacteria bacterium]